MQEVGIESAAVEKDENASNYPVDATGYISANYIDWLEASGAKTMPIAYNEPNEITDQKLKLCDGILMPGGAGDYMEKARYVYDKLKD